MKISVEKIFPDVECADQDGFLCYGGNLSPQMLLSAYAQGIFPWFSGEIPYWWAPDPRAILPLDAVHIPRRLVRKLKAHPFRVSINHNFYQVIRQCAAAHKSLDGSGWLSPKMISAYTRLHNLGFAHSFEVWSDSGELVGGLYGVGFAGVFFGESMFHLVSDASRAALLLLTEFLRRMGVSLLDCQQYTENMARMGCIEITRKDFMDRLSMAFSSFDPSEIYPWNMSFFVSKQNGYPEDYLRGYCG